MKIHVYFDGNKYIIYTTGADGHFVYSGLDMIDTLVKVCTGAGIKHKVYRIQTTKSKRLEINCVRS